MIEDEFIYTCVKGECKYDEPQFYKIKIFKPSIYYITINQKSKRKFNPASKYRYSDAQIVIGKILSDRQFSFVGGV